MIIPRKVEEKIRYLCRKFPTLEWSGVLFISHQGTFEEDNLVITCEDIYPMDLGSSGFTEFKMDETVAGYMAENIELFDCELALLHSHNTMQCWFSGTDINTLQDEGNERNCFVSLIVNNAGNYCAAITRKMKTETEVVTKSLGTSYEFFGEGKVETDEDPMSESTRIVDKEVIQYFMLDIEKEEAPNPLAWLDTRFEEIQKKKETVSQVRTKSTWYLSDTPEVTPKEEKKVNGKPWDEELTLWDKDIMKEMEVGYVPDPDKIHDMVVKLVLCSLIVDTKKVDLKQWIVRHMKNKYEQLFIQDLSFELWCDFAIEYLFNEYSDSAAPTEFYQDTDALHAYLAEAMIDELGKYPSNDYIESYINLLNGYLYS